MIEKKPGALLGSLLLLAAVMPMATAHLSNTGSFTSGIHTMEGNGDGPDFCRWDGTGAAYTSVDAAVDYVDDALSPATGGDFDADCDGNPAVVDGFRTIGISGSYINDPSNAFLDIFPFTMGGVGTIFPEGYFANANAYCDLEVLGSGSAHEPLDEDVVDGDDDAGAPGHPQAIPGLQPDGTWDDGGIGGACHKEDQYAHDPYNTPGCGTGGSHAVAEDLVSGEHVWIGATCDQVTQSRSDLTVCALNKLQSEENILDCVIDPIVCTIIQLQNGDDMRDCVNPYLNPTITCGSDGVTDTINYGEGGGSGSYKGVPFPSSTLCPDPTGGASTVFTFNYALVDGWTSIVPGIVNWVPATVGWIDSRNDLSDQLFSAQSPIIWRHWTECGNVYDDDWDQNGYHPDGDIDQDDPGCHSGPLGTYNPLDDYEHSEGDRTHSCEDGIDNGADGFTDWEDPDCWDSNFQYNPNFSEDT